MSRIEKYAAFIDEMERRHDEFTNELLEVSKGDLTDRELKHMNNLTDHILFIKVCLSMVGSDLKRLVLLKDEA